MTCEDTKYVSFKVPRLVGIEFFYTRVQRFVTCASHWNSRVGYSINCQANLLSSTNRVIILTTKHQSFNQIIEFSVSVVFNVIIFSREFTTPSVSMMFIPNVSTRPISSHSFHYKATLGAPTISWMTIVLILSLLV